MVQKLHQVAHTSSPEPSWEFPGYWLIPACTVAVLCYLSTRLAFELGAPPYHVSSFWLATPILVAVLLLTPRKIWLVLAAAGLAAIAAGNIQNGTPLKLSIWFSVGDLVEVLVATLGIRLVFRGVPQLTEIKNMARYFVIAVVLAPFASAMVGAATIAREDYWLQVRLWFCSGALGFLTVTPAILIWVREGRTWARKYQNWLESVVLFALLLLVGARLFTGQERTESPAFLYLLVPLLLWASLRLGVKGLSFGILIIAVLSIWGASHGRGPFIESAPDDRVFSLQLFLFFTAVPFVFLAVLWEERTHMEEELLNERVRLDEGQHLAQVGSWQWDRGTDTVIWSKESARMVGHDYDQPPPAFMEHSKYYTPASWALLTRTVEDALRTGLPYALDLETIRPNGSRGWFRARGEVVRGIHGKIVGLRGTIQDVTDRKRAEQDQIMRSAIVESTDEAIIYENLEGLILTWNNGARRIFGYAKEEIIGRRMTLITPTELQAAGVDMLRRLRAGDRIEHYETTRLSKDGRTIDVSISASPVRDLEGNVIGVSEIARDITQIKRAEAGRRESEERFQLAMQNMCEGLYILDRQGLVTYLNPAAENMFRRKSKELIGKHMHDVMHPQDPDRAPCSASECLAVRVPEDGIAVLEREDEFSRRDGTFFPVVFSVSPLRKADKIVGIVVVFRDDTQRRKAEQAVRESEERFRLVANTAPVMIWMSGVDKLCTYLNQPWLEFTGKSLDQELGSGWAEGVYPEDLDRCSETFSKAFDRREPFQIEYRLRRNDREYRTILNSGVPRFNQDGSFAGYIGSAIDVTDRKLAEEAISRVGGRLIQAHEEERTRIARELHDDIAQRLGLLATELERVGHSPLHSSDEVRDQIHDLWERALELSSDVQGISHRLHSSKLKYLGIVVAAKSFCRELSETQQITITFRDEDVPSLVPEEIALCLYRVLQEALQNAVKYSGVRQFDVYLHGSPDEIQLTVRDEGIGFKTETAMHTQGLGLISMLERVNLVNGTFSISSKPNLGTEVDVRVPLSAGAQSGQAKSAAH